MPRPKRDISPPNLILAARDLRRNPTAGEAALWQALRKKKIDGARFRRQHVVGPYVLDFYCLSLGLAIEIDGQGHAEPEQKRYDLERTEYLKLRGVTVLRFWNEQVENHLDEVVETIRKWIEGRKHT